MSETPRTDASEFVVHGYPASHVVPSSEARKLERELRKERARLRFFSELWVPTGSASDEVAKWIRVGDHNGMCLAIDEAIAREIATVCPEPS